MKRKIAIGFLAAALVAIVALVARPLYAQERVSFGYAYTDDGSCGDATNAVEGAYSRTGGALEVDAMVRVAPSGGDCRQDYTSYRLSAERSVGTWGVAKFLASENSFSAPYAQVVGGMVDLRADGQAAFPVALPAGVAKAVVASLGGSWQTAIGEIDLTYNIVPIDWADGSSDRTVGVAWSRAAGAFDLSASIESSGSSSFGSLGVTYTRGAAEVVVDYDFGLNELYDGAPMYQDVGGARFVAAGAPQDDQLTVSVRIGFDL